MFFEGDVSPVNLLRWHNNPWISSQMSNVQIYPVSKYVKCFPCLKMTIWLSVGLISPTIGQWWMLILDWTRPSHCRSRTLEVCLTGEHIRDWQWISDVVFVEKDSCYRCLCMLLRDSGVYVRVQRDKGASFRGELFSLMCTPLWLGSAHPVC